MTIENVTYLTRGDLRAMGWDQTKIQNFAHDRTVKSVAGRGRPSYLYLESRVTAANEGKSIPVSAIRKASISNAPNVVAASMPEPVNALSVNASIMLDRNNGRNDFAPLVVCSKSQTISDPIAICKHGASCIGCASDDVKKNLPKSIPVNSIDAPIPRADFFGPIAPKRIKVVIVDENGNETSVSLDD